MAKARIAIVGCGFTGIAIGLALKAALKDIEVIGHDRDREAMRRAEASKAIDKSEWNLPATCDSAAAIFITIPQEGLEVTLKAIAKDLEPQTLIATVGGLNSVALKYARELLPQDVAFFATNLVFHPDRVSAVAATATAESVKDAMWTIAPRPGTTPDMVDVFAGLVSEAGAKPIFVDPTERDGLAMSVDALPPVLSSALMLAVSNDDAWRERQWMAGAAFGDAVAGADSAENYASMLMAQPEAAMHWLNQVMLQCMALRDAIRDRDAAEVDKLLQQARERRERWLADWRKGRDDGRAPVQQKHSMLSMFVGERMAGRISSSSGSGKKR
jgi:prephenate dehydrogenase